MLTLSSGRNGWNCSGLTRRSFLRIGSLGMAGLSLPWLLREKAQAARNRRVVRDKAVIVLFLDGGPPQVETFDPKMEAPEPARSLVGEVQTTLPGVTFGGCFPRLASHAKSMAIVRSFHTRNFDHNPGYVLQVDSEVLTPRVERRQDHPSWGSYYARLAGALNHAGIPAYVHLLPTMIDPSLMGRPDGTGPGKLGAAYGPVDPGGKSDFNRSLKLSLSPKQLDDRRSLLNQLDRLKRETEGSNQLDSMDQFQQQAFQILTGQTASKAFDLSLEHPAVSARYDTSEFRISEGPVEGLRKFSPHALGKQLLLARRLCEAGCGFVVVHSGGWDMHGRPKEGFFGVPDGMRALGPAVDKAVSAFIEDVHDRGLSDKILLVICGEMGREPRVEGQGGRDHWGRLAALALVGGGLKMGQVIGRSDRTGGTPATEPIETYQLACTVMQTLIDVGEVRLQRDIPANIVEFLSGKPIEELI